MSAQAAVAAVETLTPRQQQILSLIQAGKVNKEVARELGIEEGTVKQHVVAIFKKLNVHNRTMAIQKWQTYQQAIASEAMQSTTSQLDFRTQLERRPCVVIAFHLSSSLAVDDRRLILTTINELAVKFHALFISRQLDSCELVFGVSRVYAYQASIAIQVMRLLQQRLDKLMDQLSGAIQTGMLIASIDRYGGWTEEVIASPVIAKVRLLAAQAVSGRLVLGTHVQQALNIEAVFDSSSLENDIDWLKLNSLSWLSCQTGANSTTTSSLTGQVICIGAFGVGKSTLLASLVVQRASISNDRIFWVKCLPDAFDKPILDCRSGRRWSWKQWFDFIQQSVSVGTVLLVDDVQWLAMSAQVEFADWLMGLSADIEVVLTSSRPLKAFSGLKRIEIKAWSEDQLVNHAQEQWANWRLATVVQQRSWLALAAGSVGVLQQLCALQVDVSDKHHYAWPLLVKVAAELDAYPLDRCLLKQLSLQKTPLETRSIADLLPESVDYLQDAVTYLTDLYWLTRVDSGGFEIRQPLVKWVIGQLMVHHMILEGFPSSG